jgi:hypothetical protein
MTENEELKDSKVDTRSLVISIVVQQPLGKDEETLSPSTSVRITQWFTQTLRDAQEYVEVPRSTFRERIPLKKFPYYT